MAKPSTKKTPAPQTIAKHPRKGGDVHLIGDDCYTVVVRGTPRYESSFTEFLGPKRGWGGEVDVEVQLVREPGNSHDRNAIRVLLGGGMVGYVAAEQAAWLAPAIDRDFAQYDRILAFGVVTGGWKTTTSEGHFGLRLDIEP